MTCIKDEINILLVTDFLTELLSNCFYNSLNMIFTFFDVDFDTSLNNNEKIVDKLLEYGADVNVNIENRAEVNTDTKPAAADGRRSKKKYRKKTPRKKIKSSSTHHGKKSKKQCKDLLQKKIRINILEFKKGRWKSPKQAVAVSYSQIRKRFPECLFPRKK